MSSIDQFKEILKKKGTGKTMSKHMDPNDIQFVIPHLKDTTIPMATKSTLLTAWMMLNNTTEEATALQHLKENIATLLPKDLHFLFKPSFDNDVDQCIQQLIHHEPISTDQLNHLLDGIITNRIQDYKAASLFEGLRLKEETPKENQTVYDFFRSKTVTKKLNLPLLLDIATPYDGFNRNYFLQPFVSALLASIGIPSVIHGVYEVSPKRGMNTHKLFQMADKNPLKSMEDVAADISNPDIGWGYIDQSIFCPSLNQLVDLRQNIVKRPVLATIEKWLQPFSALHTACITGFTHPPYKQKTIDIVHHSKLFQQLILVRGVEGSSLLPFDRRTPFITSINNLSPDMSSFISPTDVGLTTSTIDNQNPSDSLQAGIDGLTGKNNDIMTMLIYQALAICTALNRDISSVRSDVQHAITSGKALHHWAYSK